MDPNDPRLLPYVLFLVTRSNRYPYGCVFCAGALLAITSEADRVLELLEALPVEGPMHKPGAWRRIQGALEIEGHHHRDTLEERQRVARLLRNLLHIEALPAPPPAEVPAIFASVFDD